MNQLRLLFCLIVLSLSATANAQGLVDFEIFNIDNTRDTTLICKNGSRVNIPKQSFILAEDSTNVAKEISIKIKEVLQTDEMVLEGISTVSDGKVLQSAGMIYIEAHKDGQKLVLKKDQQLKVEIATTESLSGMELFNMEAGSNNWKTDTSVLRLDTCKNYKAEFIWSSKQVSKKEYKKWKKTDGYEAYKEYGKNRFVFKGRVIDTRFVFGGGTSDTRKEHYIYEPTDTLWVCDETAASTYQFKMSKLGWANVDKFLAMKRSVKSKVITEEELKVYMIFPKQNICLLGLEKEKHLYSFAKLPSNRRAVVVGYKQVDGNKVHYTKQKIITRTGIIILPPTQEVGMEEFREVMKKLSR